ncbi:MAG: purple acid phosphatase family protein [Planctomycetota bacterium]|jgi:acid phosphatase
MTIKNQMLQTISIMCLLAVLPGCGAETTLRALGLLCPPDDPAATREIPPFSISDEDPDLSYERFIAIGDMGTGHAGQFEIGAAMAERADRDGLDFIITAGDNIYENGVSSAADPQWVTKFEEPYADPALDVPFYPTLGNHDHRGDPDAQIEYGERNPNWIMPARHYTFTRMLDDDTKVQFFAIDTTPMLDIFSDASAQVTWLDQSLADSDARWKIVFGHHPLFSHGPHGSQTTLINLLKPVFDRHDVDVYFAGHDHTLEMLKPRNGTHYVISGAGAGEDKAFSVAWGSDAYYAATLGGFTYMRISRNELVIEFVRPDARTEYAHTLRK